MMSRYDIEEVIFGLADIIKENRALHQYVDELELECEKYKAYFYGESKKANILSEISIHNAAVKSAQSSGWLTSQEYIDDWHTELERRMNEEENASD